MDQPRPFVEPGAIELPRAPECAALAREFVRSRWAGSAAGESLDAALLVTSELVTNAWKHGEGAIRLRIEGRADRLRLEVIDGGDGAAHGIRPRTGGAHGGWGLRIVEDMAVDWGCFAGTTHVWAEIELDA